MKTLTTEYLDVFQETQTFNEIVITWVAIPPVFIIFILVFGVAMCRWMMSGTPGLPDNLSHKAWNRVTLGVIVAYLAVTIAGGITVTSVLINNNNEAMKIEEVRLNVAHNIKEKYGSELKSLTKIPQAEDRDEPQPYEVALTPQGGKEKAVYKTFMIRFDRETSEPFISEG